MNTDITSSAKLFIQLELDKQFPNWEAISNIAIMVKKSNDDLTLSKEDKIQEILAKDVQDSLMKVNTL